MRTAPTCSRATSAAINGNSEASTVAWRYLTVCDKVLKQRVFNRW